MITASRVVAGVLAATAIVLVTSCTRTIDDARVVAAADMGTAASDGLQCTSVDASLTTIPDRGDDEPVMKIPQPEAWQRVTMLDSEVIRFTMRNQDLARDGFSPIATVTLESQPGFSEARVVFDSQQAALQEGFGAGDLRVSEHTLCGLPAETLHYTVPAMGPVAAHPAVVVCTVLHTDDRTFAATLTIQTTDPDNPTYQRDSQTILDGFQMLPPVDE